jgi:hypothetical protein
MLDGTLKNAWWDDVYPMKRHRSRVKYFVFMLDGTRIKLDGTRKNA